MDHTLDGVIISPSVEKRLREGRGQGHGKGYVPWVIVHDFSSKGDACPEWGSTTGRKHDLMSRWELKYFRVVDNLARAVKDIREQWPLLPIDATVFISKSLGIPHPADREGLVVMTTDFLLDVEQNDRILQVARTIKMSHELHNPRTLEKLAIEQVYYQTRGIDWAIVTDKDIPEELYLNADRVRGHKNLGAGISPELFRRVEPVLFKNVAGSKKSLAETCFDTDAQLRLTEGDSLSMVYHCIANGYWDVDLARFIDPGKPLQVCEGLAAAAGGVSR